MRYLIVSVLISLILLTACAPARQKLSPHGNIALKDANVYYQQKNIERALESYQKVLKDNPDHVLALRRVADINLYYGEQDQSKTIEFNKLAFENYDKAIAIVESFDNLKETEQVELRDMRRRRTSAWTRIYSAAEQLQNQGNTKEAMRGFQIAIDLDNERFEPLIKLKDIYVKELKDLDKAEKIMLQLYQKRPKEVMLLLEIGAFYYDKQDFSRALDFFQKASVEAPTDADILMNISFCYYEMKDFANALKNTEKVLVLAPRNLDALRNARSIALR
ncbi:MAG: tetratricopeptide repeat protein, partial [Candidatus Cloacimonadaceae bacterium]|nr:tetratricopeptide repeat protein [Candidatus Cloacimonadaceae bacterium]